MNLLARLKTTKGHDLSILKNPFEQSHVTRIKMEYEKEWFKDSYIWTAYVYFKNGDTSGDQKFQNANFDVITKQIHDFIESL